MTIPEMRPIARMRSDFGSKFGIPRQSGMVESLRSLIVFEPELRIPEALRGLEEYSHLWLIWCFSENSGWSPTVRPPRLGGNVRMGVFATRSPFRPNPIGLSCVELVEIREEPGLGLVIEVAGADLLDGTPILDIKPYVPYSDSRPDASSGFVGAAEIPLLEVELSDNLALMVPPEKRAALLGILANDPRPQYQNDPERVYGLSFAGLEVRFKVAGKNLTVTEIEKAAQ